MRRISMTNENKTLLAEQQEELLKTLKTRFEKNIKGRLRT